MKNRKDNITFFTAGLNAGLFKLTVLELREAIKKISYFFVRKREGGSRTKPIFLYKDNLGSNFMGRGG